MKHTGIGYICRRRREFWIFIFLAPEHVSWDIEEAEHVGTIPLKNGAPDLGAVGLHNSASSVAKIGNQAVVSV